MIMSLYTTQRRGSKRSLFPFWNRSPITCSEDPRTCCQALVLGPVGSSPSVPDGSCHRRPTGWSRASDPCSDHSRYRRPACRKCCCTRHRHSCWSNLGVGPSFGLPSVKPSVLCVLSLGVLPQDLSFLRS